jgi:hypothetical protein
MRAAAIFAAATAVAATGAPAQMPDPREPQVLAAIRTDLGADGFGQGASYAIAFSDLNDDHHQEAVVHLAGRDFCGTGGCTTYVLTETEAGWLKVGRMSVSRLPIYRLPMHHGGWFDLGVYTGGGGMQPAVRGVIFDRGSYRSNPTKGPVIGRLPQEATVLLPATSDFVPIGQ